MSAAARGGLHVVHVVVTDQFAGVERYVSVVAREQRTRGHRVTVVGGTPLRPACREAGADWLPGSTVAAALRSLFAVTDPDVVHVHMTAAELAGVVAGAVRRRPVVATRHFAQPRGSHVLSRALSRLLNHRLAAQVAISRFVAERVERAPDVVSIPGTPVVDAPPYGPDRRTVLVLQRLEPEKCSLLAIEGWEASGLARAGWRMRFVGNGSQRRVLQQRVAERGLEASVGFAGWSDDVPGHLDEAAFLLATAPAEPLGLSVVEAMARGVPVLASAAGGHLETVGRVPEAPLFPVGDSAALGTLLAALGADDSRRVALSACVRQVQRQELSTSQHVDDLQSVYERVLVTCL